MKEVVINALAVIFVILPLKANTMYKSINYSIDVMTWLITNRMGLSELDPKYYDDLLRYVRKNLLYSREQMRKRDKAAFIMLIIQAIVILIQVISLLLLFK